MWKIPKQSYTDEFKREAVKLVEAGEKPAAVAKLVALPLSQAIFNNHLSIRTRVVLYGIVAMTFYVALVQQSDWKSGWVPAAVAAAALVGLKFKKVIPFTIPFVVMVAAYLAQDLISTDMYSWGTRVDAWLVVLDISRVSPIIGLGFSNYYWYAKVFSIRGYSIKFNSHSQFVDIIAQTGVLGLACFMWILIEIGRLAWKLMSKVMLLIKINVATAPA